MGRKVFPAITSELDNVLAMLEVECEQMNAPMAAQMQLSVAVEELFVNVANYAYTDKVISGDSIIPASQTDQSKKCTVSVEKEGDSIVVTLEDEGKPFDPFTKDDPDITQKAEDRDVGGLGIFLVKKTMDECNYKRENGHNIVSIKKKVL